MGWTWAPTAKHVIAILKETIEKQASFSYLQLMEGRIRELMEKVMEFEKEYFSDGEDVCLGYLIISKPYDVLVKAIVIYGENEPKVAVVDIEEWLRGDKDDP
ncbi:MAG: hypothetical protein LM558_04950 [Thermosphaera sp.]|nr:hypothetical protein [Thermosphaera sp.]